MSSEAQRAELHRTIWRIANDLRGSVDGWDFKTYVLGLLFYRFISENLTAYLNEAERAAGNPDFEYSELGDRDAEPARRGHRGGEGLLHRALGPVRQRPRESASGREPQRDAAPGVLQHRGLRCRRGQRARPQGSVRRPRRQLLQARQHGRAGATRSSSSCSTPSATSSSASFQDNKIDAFGDAYEYLMTMYASIGRQVRWGVLHPAGGLRAPRPDHRGRQDRGEQGLRPGLRVRLAAAEVRQGPRQGQRPPGLLRSGDQPDHLQPVPDQHVPARHQLREVRHRPRRHPHRPAALGRRAVRGDRVQPALLHQVGGRRQPAADQRPPLRPGRRAGAEVQGGPRVHDAHAQLARGQRHRRHRRVPRRAVPRRGRAEDPQVPDRQQLRRHGHPAPAGPVLRHHHRHLHHRAQEVQARRRRPVHRRLGPVRPAGQQEPAHRGPPRAHPGRLHRTGRQRSHRPARAQRPRSPRTPTTSRSPPGSKPTTTARSSTSPSSTPRSPASSPARPSCGPRSTRSSRTSKAPRHDGARPAGRLPAASR